MTDKLRNKVTQGVKAKEQWDLYVGVFARLQKRYHSELVMRVREGDPTEPAAHKLAALDDVVRDLTVAIQQGHSAQEKLDDIAQQAAQKVEYEDTI